VARAAASITVVVVALIACVSPASAEARVYGVPCWKSSAAVLETKPRHCVLASGPASYQQARIRNIRWRSWGGRTSYGRGVLLGNMGFRARVTFKLYRLDRYEEDFYIYRRARGRTQGIGTWTMRLMLF
jgi:hypothetical protein